LQAELSRALATLKNSALFIWLNRQTAGNFGKTLLSSCIFAKTIGNLNNVDHKALELMEQSYNIAEREKLNPKKDLDRIIQILSDEVRLSEEPEKNATAESSRRGGVCGFD
jgi:hypothetical protein